MYAVICKSSAVKAGAEWERVLCVFDDESAAIDWKNKLLEFEENDPIITREYIIKEGEFVDLT